MHNPFSIIDREQKTNEVFPWFLIRPIPLLGVVILIVWALVTANNTVNKCQVSKEWDAWRDISIAQSLYDGTYPEDPILSREISWYNPLTGIIIAVSGCFSDLPLQRITVLIGPYINLLAILGFVAFTIRLFGYPAALAGLCLALFGKEHTLPFWTFSYSPWLLAPMYSFGLFFLTLLAYVKAEETRKPGMFLLSGILLGVTFLAHTAPAVIAGGTMALASTVHAFRTWRKDNTRKEALIIVIQLSLLLLVAFFISLPYTGPIIWRYQFQVLNPWPSLYSSQNMELDALPSQALKSLSLRNMLAFLGLIHVLLRGTALQKRLILCWGLVVLGLLIQFYIWQALKINGIIMSSIVPGHHAGLHLSAFRTVLFGCGLYTILESLQFILSSLPKFRIIAPLFKHVLIWPAVIMTGILLYASNPYSGRIDFSPPGPDEYRRLFESYIPLSEWILTNTPPESVFLCEDETLGMQAIMPVARKIVCPMLLYSNPYVDWGILINRQNALLSALRSNNHDAFCQEMSLYQRLFYIRKEGDSWNPPFCQLVYQGEGVCIYNFLACD